MNRYQDSTGAPITEGDTVKFRGKNYTIKTFRPCDGPRGKIAVIEFNEPQHTPEPANEWSVDKVCG